MVRKAVELGLLDTEMDHITRGIMLEAARLLCYKVLWMREQGLRHTKEGAMCKWWGPEMSFEIVRKCLTIHGHYGYSSEFPFEQRLRDI